MSDIIKGSKVKINQKCRSNERKHYIGRVGTVLEIRPSLSSTFTFIYDVEWPYRRRAFVEWLFNKQIDTFVAAMFKEEIIKTRG